MPRIRDELLESVVYFYPSVQDATEAVDSGASGFIINIPSEVAPDSGWLFIVTNSHVVREGKCNVLRLNAKDGGIGIIEMDDSVWFHHPDGDDVAVAPLLGNIEWRQIRSVSTRFFLTKEDISEVNIGPGDEVYMVGRFIGHDGKQRNQPSVRTGNIAMMPIEPIVVPGSGLKQESFLVEVRSLPGYSGSPVFVWIPPSDIRQDKRPGKMRMLNDRSFTALLGIDWCHLRTRESVREKTGEPISEGWYVESNSGMAGIVPAWKIAELIDSEGVRMERKKADEDLAKEIEQAGVTLDIESPSGQVHQRTLVELDIPVPTRGQFFGDLQKTVRKKPLRKKSLSSRSAKLSR